MRSGQRWEKLLIPRLFHFVMGMGVQRSERSCTAEPSSGKDRVRFKGEISSCLIIMMPFFYLQEGLLVAGVRSALKGMECFSWKWHLICLGRTKAVN